MAKRDAGKGADKRVGKGADGKSGVAELRTKPQFTQLNTTTQSTAEPDRAQAPKARPDPDEQPVYESLRRATDARDLEQAIAGGYQSLRAYIQLRAARAVNLVFEATELGLQSGQFSSGTVGGAKLVLEHALLDPVDVKLGKDGDTKRKLVDRVQALTAIELQLARDSEATH